MLCTEEFLAELDEGGRRLFYAGLAGLVARSKVVTVDERTSRREAEKACDEHEQDHVAEGDHTGRGLGTGLPAGGKWIRTQRRVHWELAPLGR